MSQNPAKFQKPQIYFPKLFTAVSSTVPHIEMTAKEAVAAGYSFRKKRHSVKITQYRGKAQMQLNIPYTIDGMPVDEVCAHTFKEMPCNTINIHGNIRKLGKGVFYDCTAKTVIFEDGLTALHEYIFSDCESLEQVHLPLTLKYIGKRCFMRCKNLKYIEFPKSICVMEDLAFCACGLEGFGVEARTPGIYNGEAFSVTPLLEENQVVCAYPDSSNLTVLHVGAPFRPYSECGAPIKFKADSITFCRWSLRCFSIDLSECKKVRFCRNAIRDERERDRETVAYVVNPSLMILPESEENKQHYAFPKHVTVVNYFSENGRLYKGPVEIDYDDDNDSCVVTPVADYLPARSVGEKWDKIRIAGHAKADRYAVNFYQLQEITFDDFRPEDTVFSLFCVDLRKVTFRYKGQMYTKYIPPQELVSYTVHTILTFAFAPCTVPCENGFRHTVYNRQIIDSIFPHRRINSDNNQALAMLSGREHKRMGESHWKQKLYLTMTHKIKALIAVDVLRSDRLIHEPPVDMYLDFLKKHCRFCRRYFQTISGKYPEYLQAFEQIISDCDSNN
ncbi:MAG: leucine-rich repeat domain-containing protein [Oscillospiraceae bacterium]|nr:leucine-rich repeat domain-containing protein [Oscillospiraceae bacterium]